MNRNQSPLCPGGRNRRFACILAIATVLLPRSATLVRAQEPSLEYYCGTDWDDAAAECHRACPSGRDDDCTDLGFQCFYYTGCSSHPSVTDPQEEEEEEEEETVEDPYDNNYCGSQFLDATITCLTPCPNGNECVDGETCFAATNCNTPLQTLTGDMIVTLGGPSGAMDGEDSGVFEETVLDFMADQMGSENGILFDSVGVTDQSISTRRTLGWKTVGGGGVQLGIANATHRLLPSGSSALDVSMVITGDYRPPPYIDLNVLAVESINSGGSKLSKDLKARGARRGRRFFEAVEDISATAAESATARPTRAPSATPTARPTGAPTAQPSLAPSGNPSVSPSSQPTRDHLQSIITGSREDLNVGGSTTTSYGLIFNVRTKPDSPAILVKGMDFYTGNSGLIKYELWSRPESFRDFKGNFDGWTLIASGEVKGRGTGRFTQMDPRTFSGTPISGRGGTRAFYISLHTIDLVYKLGTGIDSDIEVFMSTPELELYEGEGVLSTPFPDPIKQQMYRRPRQFLGAIFYDRLPCKPFSVHGFVEELPCPDVPTQSPTVSPKPTERPTQSPTSKAPVTSPPTNVDGSISNTPTDSPTTRPPTTSPTTPPPTVSPTTHTPTSSPIVLMKAHIITRLRNVPDRNMTPVEINKFVEILDEFLKKHTQLSLIVESVDARHQDLIVSESEEATVSVENTIKKIRGSVDNSENSTENANSRPTTEVTSIEVTLTVRISYSLLPESIMGNMLAVAISEHERELIRLMHDQQAFYSYYKNIDGVAARVIDKVTNPPSPSPTSYKELLSNQALVDKDEEEEISSGATFSVFVGLIVGILWCCLTISSVSYLIKARSTMREEKKMEELLKQETDKPDLLESNANQDDVSHDGSDIRSSASDSFENGMEENEKFDDIERSDDVQRLAKSMPNSQKFDDLSFDLNADMGKPSANRSKSMMPQKKTHLTTRHSGNFDDFLDNERVRLKSLSKSMMPQKKANLSNSGNFNDLLGGERTRPKSLSKSMMPQKKANLSNSGNFNDPSGGERTRPISLSKSMMPQKKSHLSKSTSFDDKRPKPSANISQSMNMPQPNSQGKLFEQSAKAFHERNSTMRKKSKKSKPSTIESFLG